MQNPFLIDVGDKALDEYTWEDYVAIQKQLKDKNDVADEWLKPLYPLENFSTSYEMIRHRCTRGLNQTIIDLESQNVPVIQHFTIGQGGDCCFVCCTPAGNDRCQSSQSISTSLEKVGFHGHFLLLNGGFPHPTGMEMKYVGVPYCFKVFMMLEAKKRGFHKVIWIDAACYAVKNPQSLFDKLQQQDVIFRSFDANLFQPHTCNNIVLPQTIDLLNHLVNRDIRNDINVNSIVFGLNFDSEKISQWVEEYYDMVAMGWPFLSSFPEEIVFSTLFNKPEYAHVFQNRYENEMLYIHECYMSADDACRNGYYFIQRGY